MFKEYERCHQDILAYNTEDTEDISVTESHYFSSLSILNDAIKRRALAMENTEPEMPETNKRLSTTASYNKKVVLAATKAALQCLYLEVRCYLIVTLSVVWYGGVNRRPSNTVGNARRRCRDIQKRLTYEDYTMLAGKIITLFPKETAATYFTRPIRKRDSYNGKSVAARGKLVDKVRNYLFQSGECKRKYLNTTENSKVKLSEAEVERRRICNSSAGRPQKDFEECSERSKRRKTQDLRSSTGTLELTYAAEMKLRSEGNIQAAKVLAEIVKSPDSAKNYIKKDDVKITKLTEDKALSLITNAKLTKYQYNIIRSNALEENCPLCGGRLNGDVIVVVLSSGGADF
ncbi:unnamed protein product [Diatraea saccharalis]|uniref:Uncharacterized protein n=1 Tax=Diatraea saccharalis TaxID=40085 RepID=A0A9N9N141_9NEOP|nr:unnamed protein product [Diatraea saccharalis]